MKTNYLKNKILDHITGKTTYTKPTNTYLGLMTGDPTVAGTPTQEVTGGSYARQQVAWSTAANGLTHNTSVITFPAMPSANIKYWGVFDAATNGNLLEYFPFEVPLVITAGATPSIDANNLILREA